MAEIDIYKIEEELAKILREDPKLQVPELGKTEATVEVETNFDIYPDVCPWVGIYLISEDSPPELELLGGLSPFRTFITFEIVVIEYALTNEDSSRLRNRLFTKVKSVIKANRKINGLVLQTVFDGTEFDSANDEDGAFFKTAVLGIKCEVRE